MVSLDHNYTIHETKEGNKQDYTLKQFKSVGSAPQIRNIIQTPFEDDQIVGDGEKRVGTFDDWGSHIAVVWRIKWYMLSARLTLVGLYWGLSLWGIFAKRTRKQGVIGKIYNATLGRVFDWQNRKYILRYQQCARIFSDILIFQ